MQIVSKVRFFSLIFLFSLLMIVLITKEVQKTGYNMNCDWFSQEQHLAPSNCF